MFLQNGENLKERVLNLLKEEPKGVATLMVSKKLKISTMEAKKILEELVKEGVVEKRGGNYRLLKW
ncbi:MAG: hypothetical protein N3E48_02325 [Candidatus Bathyarchaeota archaeon]|nr:hypothetical protein [Candidatus Bathyarchaeota archaeon]